MKPHILGLVLLNCCSLEAAKAPKSTVTQNISYCDLVKDPLSFSGKRIRVRAIYKYGFELQRLDPPECCRERGTKIWVEIDDASLEDSSIKRFHKFPEGMGLALATFVGKFESGGPYGDGGYRFKLNVDQIEKVESTARPSPHHDPSWVPKNCETATHGQPLSFELASAQRLPTELGFLHL